MTSAAVTWREDFQLWWPDYDKSPEECFRRVKGTLRDMDHAIGLCARRRVVVQAGGHAGLWPIRLAHLFSQVHTFECEPRLFDCLQRNLSHHGAARNVTARPEALGTHAGEVMMRGAPSAGSWRIDPAGQFKVDQVAIDDLELRACDFICLDVEGYEAEVLLGAEITVRMFQPVIQVEELPRAQLAIRRVLKGFGYRQVARVHNDFVYSPALR